MDTPYIPIACNFHDQLLHYATLHELLTVSILENGAQVEFEARIDDVFTRDAAEFIRFGNGNQYRLDQLVQVNGQYLAEGYCAI